MKYRIAVSKPHIGKRELDLVTEAVKSGWVSSKGKFVSEFEEKFSSYIGVNHGISTSNGTVALHLALEAIGIGKNDKVIVPDLTFVATANSVLYTGAKPIFVDVHPEYWGIDPLKIEEKIDKNTKAMMIVPLYGHPCDMEKLLKIAEDCQLFVIEDCAEAHGAEFKGRKIGTFGDINTFSFYGNKIITTGEGGMCLTNNEELAEKMRILRDHGESKLNKFWYEQMGFNYRMTNLQAAIGVAQMERINELVQKRIDIAKEYQRQLSHISGISLHPCMPWAKNVYWLYSILIKDNYGVSRDTLIKKFEEKGIETRPFFHPLHRMPYLSYFDKQKNFPVSENLSRKGLNLPTSTELTNVEIDEIENIISFF